MPSISHIFFKVRIFYWAFSFLTLARMTFLNVILQALLDIVYFNTIFMIHRFESWLRSCRRPLPWYWQHCKVLFTIWRGRRLPYVPVHVCLSRVCSLGTRQPRGLSCGEKRTHEFAVLGFPVPVGLHRRFCRSSPPTSPWACLTVVRRRLHSASLVTQSALGQASP